MAIDYKKKDKAAITTSTPCRYSALGTIAIAVYILQFVCYSCGDFTVKPVNTAVVSGSITTLHCSSNNSLITWNLFQYPSSDFLSIALSCQVNPLYTDIYSVTSSQSGQCDLNIISNSSVAGRYNCLEGFNTTTANLIVLDAPPSVSTNSSGEYVFEYNYTTLICLVNFTGVISPSIKWLAPGNVPITNGSYYNTTKEVEAIIEIPAYSNTEWSEYLCEVYFQQPPPYFIMNVSAPNLTVYSCPASVSISPNGGDLNQGQSLICLVSGGNPPPNFSWTNLATGDVTVGQTVIPTSSGYYSYECLASNPACNISAIANGTVVPTPVTGSSTTAIIIGVCVGAAAIILIIIIVIFIYCQCRRKKGKKNKRQDSRNNVESNTNNENARTNYPRPLPVVDYVRPPESLPPSRYRYPEVSSSYVDRISISDCGQYSEHRSRYSDIEV